MTFAVVGILGHFSKMLLLFFIPQILNFAYSVPQLFNWIPCPRHRLPKVNQRTGKLGTSTTTFKQANLPALGQAIVIVVRWACVGCVQAISRNLCAWGDCCCCWWWCWHRTLRLADVDPPDADGVTRMSNLTIINFFIYLCGPMREEQLAIVVLSFQVRESTLCCKTTPSLTYLPTHPHLRRCFAVSLPLLWATWWCLCCATRQSQCWVADNHNQVLRNRYLIDLSS